MRDASSNPATGASPLQEGTPQTRSEKEKENEKEKDWANRTFATFADFA
jgi:hypothetical protein